MTRSSGRERGTSGKHRGSRHWMMIVCFRPSWILLAAVVGTQILATVIALTGILMQPIGWNLVGLAWGWAFAESLLLDPIKLAAYQLLQQSVSRQEFGGVSGSCRLGPSGLGRPKWTCRWADSATGLYGVGRVCGALFRVR